MAKQDLSKPVAYDTQGRPLYLHPSQQEVKPEEKPTTPHNEVEVVQVTRSNDPISVSVSPEMQKRHDESKRRYTFLNLSAGEYVVLEVKRNPIGLVGIWLVAILVALLITLGWWFLLAHPGSDIPIVSADAASFISMIALGLVAFTLVLGWIVSYIFQANKFFLTNESVIQEIQTSLLAQKEQTINLENIKDASFDQNGILPTLFDYGALRLSTEGDEQEYHFTYVSRPKQQIAIINNVIEAVKYGRPIEEAIEDIQI